jgi:hypothetical protein
MGPSVSKIREGLPPPSRSSKSHGLLALFVSAEVGQNDRPESSNMAAKFPSKMEV